MGRRPSLVTAINRAINQAQVAERRRQREAAVNYAISSNSGAKEMAPTYRITSFEFNEDTRACKIVFLETTQYRTIEKYVTQNYVKHPIYSGWKTKTKNIKKSVKLTDENLEALQENDDFLIASHASQIIDRIDNEDYYPSWYWNDLINFDANKKKDVYRNRKTSYDQKTQEYLKSLDAEIKYCETNIATIKSNQNKNKKLELKSKKIIDKIDTASKAVILKIITLGVYGKMVSRKRYVRHSFRYNYYKKLNLDNVNDIANLEGIIALYNEEKKSIESIKTQSNSYCNKKIDALNVEQREMLALVVPLTE